MNYLNRRQVRRTLLWAYTYFLYQIAIVALAVVASKLHV